jgi:hypothetical protein
MENILAKHDSHENFPLLVAAFSERFVTISQLTDHTAKVLL